MLRGLIKVLTGLSIIVLAIAFSLLDSDGIFPYIIAIPCILWLGLMALINGLYFHGEE